MGWSFTVARVAGIEVRVHITFLLLLVWIATARFAAGGAQSAAAGLVLILAVFASVLLHEFGHALTAKRYGIRTPDITLLPIGGVARLERIPDVPRQELHVALAGPAVNLAIALGLLLYLRATGGMAPLLDLLLQGGFGAQLLVINLWLVGFNMIPAFPMDGGRVLRALLSERLGFARATQIAAGIGQGISFVFALAGIFVNPFLIFIALFVYLGAAGEVSLAKMRDIAAGVPVSDAMMTRYRVLGEHAPVADALSALLEGSQREFPVLDEGGSILGVLTREGMIQALAEHGPQVPVHEVMNSDVPVVDTCDMLERAFLQMQERGIPALPVVDRTGRLAGLLTKENVSDLMMIESALRKRGRRVDYRPKLA